MSIRHGGPGAEREAAAAIRGGDRRALARTVSRLEAGDPAGARILAALRREAAAGGDGAGPDGAGGDGAERGRDGPGGAGDGAGRAHLIGVTGSPGSGKSTLVDRLIGAHRAAGESVGVVAVDPTSPYSGGAILGDRIRMTRWHDDPEVFVRSMATRGQLGGLAAATLRVASLLDAAGFDRVVVETVGVGQSEVDVVEVADTTVLVLTPGGGDGVQAFKAGVMEIADLFVINKADLPGADRLRREIRAAQGLAPREPDAWRPPIVTTTAHDGGGTEDLVAALDDHRAWLREHGGDESRRRRRARAELAATVRTRTRQALARRGDALVEALLAGETTAEEAVADLLASLAVDPSARGERVG